MRRHLPPPRVVGVGELDPEGPARAVVDAHADALEVGTELGLDSHEEFRHSAERRGRVQGPSCAASEGRRGGGGLIFFVPLALCLLQLSPILQLERRQRRVGVEASGEGQGWAGVRVCVDGRDGIVEMLPERGPAATLALAGLTVDAGVACRVGLEGREKQVKGPNPDDDVERRRNNFDASFDGPRFSSLSCPLSATLSSSIKSSHSWSLFRVAGHETQIE